MLVAFFGSNNNKGPHLPAGLRHQPNSANKKRQGFPGVRRRCPRYGSRRRRLAEGRAEGRACEGVLFVLAEARACICPGESHYYRLWLGNVSSTFPLPGVPLTDASMPPGVLLLSNYNIHFDTYHIPNIQQTDTVARGKSYVSRLRWRRKRPSVANLAHAGTGKRGGGREAAAPSSGAGAAGATPDWIQGVGGE